MNTSESGDSSRSTLSPSFASPTGEDLSGKRGRPSKWTKSRQRKLARLYLYSTLPPKDISQALEEKDSNWKPGKESTVKTVNSLLDKQPRWLRPKNREDMIEKISELTKTKKQLPSYRAHSKEPVNDPQLISEAYIPPGFSETPLEDLFSLDTVESHYPPSPLASGSTNTTHTEPAPILYSLPFDLPFLEDSVLPYKNHHNSNIKRERSGSTQPYGYQDIARGARGIKYHTFYQCPICGRTNSHSDSYLDQMKCAFVHNRDRISPDKDGMTPAHALALYQRTNNDAELTPETPAQTAELFKVLFPHDDETFRRALCILDPSGNTIIQNIQNRKLDSVLQYFEELTADSSEPIFAKKTFEVDEKTISTYLSTSSLKKRLPQYSTRYLKGITRLIKTHSISESSDVSTTMPKNRYSLATFDTFKSEPPTVRSSGLVTPPQQRVELMLSDSFLNIDRHIQRQGLCIRGFKAHDAKTCLCHTLDGLKSKVWVSNVGIVDYRVADPPISLQFLNLGFRDHFGNGVLHMLAARGAPLDVIFEALERGVDGNTVNTSGQTFLHVIRRQVLRNFVEDSDTLMWILQKLNPFNVKVNICDVFGRSFFHLLAQQADRLEQHSLTTLQMLNIVPSSSRDAFGYVPRALHTNSKRNDAVYSYETTLGTSKNWSQYNMSNEPREFRRPNSIIHNIPNDELIVPIDVSANSPEQLAGGTNSDYDSDLHDDNEMLVHRHARLLEIARSAFMTPTIEDVEGRNGLQCLAEASLTLSIDNSQVFVKGSTNKRKADQPEPERVSSRLDLRYELVDKLVLAGVCLNNYDRAGNTVLMAFVQNLKDGEDDKTLAKLFRYLIERGANIHGRNRQGEIALHIAVKLGRKVATRVLLETGSNVHARNADELGVLGIGEKYYFKARNNPTLYASIMACMAQCIQYGAAAMPTLAQEWSVKI
ncbi:putative ankyrin repeat protein [Erysiphe neolycopersici]|uniref:Putative ankyrin repeat protein n=1 Tax=Erysiphe neolycopersici TaxID=212602 RepID=A0A420HSG8_9PEZI|nr:putative ankyrin repeat protein [Erysiphe neolycopersici]